MRILTRLCSPQSGTGRRAAAVACGVLASFLVCGRAAAQFGPSIPLPPNLPTVTLAPEGGYPATVAPTAVGTYFTPPGWSSALAPNARFVVLSNFNSDAVLDRETGLVWARQSLSRIRPTYFNEAANSGVFIAEYYCRLLVVGNRWGWRVPAVAELQSLLDPSLPTTSGPKLPPGHPFLLSPGGTNPNSYFYAGEVFDDDPAPGSGFHRWLVSLRLGQAASLQQSEVGSADIDVLCVRGGPAVTPNTP